LDYQAILKIIGVLAKHVINMLESIRLKMEQKKPETAKSQDKAFRYIVRIANTDLDGKKQIMIAMKKIKGVGIMMTNAVLEKAGIDKTKQTGILSDDEIKRLNSIFSDLTNQGFPSWMLNRRKDYETGEDKHVLSANLTFTRDNDLRRLMMIKSYRGLRHAVHLPVRGQRTKSNFRRNKKKTSLGVQRKGTAGKDKKK